MSNEEKPVGKLTINVPSVPVPLVIDAPEKPFVILSNVAAPVAIGAKSNVEADRMVREAVQAAQPKPIALIDPRAPVRRRQLAPPLLARDLDIFQACHLLLYGTVRLRDEYYSECLARLDRGEVFEWKFDSAHYMRMLTEAVEAIGYVSDETVALHFRRVTQLYLDSRGMALELRNAAQVLQEGARRGELTVRGRVSGAARHEFVTVPPDEFIDRPALSYITGDLWQRDADWEGGRPDYTDLRFQRDEVEVLRAAPWHSLREPANDRTTLRVVEDQKWGEIREALDRLRKSNSPLRKYTLAAELVTLRFPNSKGDDRGKKIASMRRWTNAEWKLIAEMAEEIGVRRA